MSVPRAGRGLAGTRGAEPTNQVTAAERGAARFAEGRHQ